MTMCACVVTGWVSLFIRMISNSLRHNAVSATEIDTFTAASRAI